MMSLPLRAVGCFRPVGRRRTPRRVSRRAQRGTRGDAWRLEPRVSIWNALDMRKYQTV